MSEHPDIDTCPICAEPLLDDDICATDIEMGICHAACLEGSPVVDLETGDERDGPMDTYRYGDTAPKTSGAATHQEATVPTDDLPEGGSDT